MTKKSAPDGGKFEDDQTEITFSQKRKLVTMIMSPISEKQFILNSISLLNVFKTCSVSDPIISSIDFNHLIDDNKFSMSAYNLDRTTMKVIKSPKYGTQNLLDI